MNLFTESNLSPDLLKAIGELGYVKRRQKSRNRLFLLSFRILAILSHLRQQEQAKQQHFRTYSGYDRRHQVVKSSY